MGDGYKVEPADLTTHAGTVSRLGEQLGKAADTGGGVDLGVDTYGIIGQFFSVSAREQISGTADSIREVAASLASLSQAVTSCAEVYELLEDGAAADYEARERVLDGE